MANLMEALADAVNRSFPRLGDGGIGQVGGTAAQDFLLLLFIQLSAFAVGRRAGVAVGIKPLGELRQFIWWQGPHLFLNLSNAHGAEDGVACRFGQWKPAGCTFAEGFFDGKCTPGTSVVPGPGGAKRE